VPPNELRQQNLYHHLGKTRQTFHPLTGLQTTNGYIPIQNRQAGPQHFDNRRQALPTDPGPSNFQNVRFIDGVIEPHHDESLHFQMGVGDEQGQWPPNTNAITFVLRSLDYEVTLEAPTLAITTIPTRENMQAQKDVEGQDVATLASFP
jgi:hypothetical protein